MRRFLLASTTSLALSTMTAWAGGTDEPIIMPSPELSAVARINSSAGGLVVPLLLLLVIAAAVSN